MRMWLCVAALLLAGCADPDPGAEGMAPTTTEGALDGPDGDDGGDGAAPVEQPPQEAVLYFTADGGLSWELPAEGRVPVGLATTSFVTGAQPVRFDLPPADHPILVLPMDIEVVARVGSDAAQVSNGMFDFAAWFGSTVGHNLFGFTTGATAMGPGEQRYALDLPFEGRRGLYVPAGESLSILVAGQFGGEAGTPWLLTGGEDASHVRLTLQNRTEPPPPGAPPVDEVLAGSVANAVAMTDCDTVPGTTSMDHAFTVDANASMVRLALAAKGNTQHVDLDMVLRDATGIVASTSTPYNTEGILLAHETLEGLQGTELALHVYSCGTGPSDYEVVVTQQ